MFEEAAQEVSAFEEAFELKHNEEDENKKRKRVYWRDIIRKEEEKAAEEQKQIEEEEQIARVKLGKGDIEKEDGVKEITSVNPIEDFKKMVSDRKVDRVSDALDQMQKLIHRFVVNSLKGDLYQKALECLHTMRETCVVEDEGQKFNLFLEQLKKNFHKGTNSEFWQSIVEDGISLITNKETITS